MPSAAFWPLDRHGSNPTPSHASPSVRAAPPTMLRGTQRIDTAVYWSLTSCHSAKSLKPSTSVEPIRGDTTGSSSFVVRAGCALVLEIRL
jgi:hypothetical protein